MKIRQNVLCIVLCLVSNAVWAPPVEVEEGSVGQKGSLVDETTIQDGQEDVAKKSPRSMFAGLKAKVFGDTTTGKGTASSENPANQLSGTGRTTTFITSDPVVNKPIDPTDAQNQVAVDALDGGPAVRTVTFKQGVQSKELQVVNDRINLLENLSKNADLTSMDILSRTVAEMREMDVFYNEKAFSIKTLSKYADSINQFFMKFDSTNLTEPQLENAKSMISDVLTSRQIPVKSISLELFNSLEGTLNELNKVSADFAKQRTLLAEVRWDIDRMYKEDQIKFNAVADRLLDKPLTLAELSSRISSLNRTVTSYVLVQKSVVAADGLFLHQSPEIQQAIYKVFSEQQADFQIALDKAFKDGLSEDSVTILTSKSLGVEGLLKSYTTASETVLRLDDRVINNLNFTDAQKNFYEKLKSLIISNVRQADNMQVLVDFVNAVQTQYQVSVLEGALDKPVTSSLIDPLMERFTQVDGRFIKRLEDQLTTLETDRAQLVREQQASLVRFSPVTALVQRGNNTFQEAPTRTNKALMGLAKLCRVFSKRLAEWVEAKKEYITIPGGSRDLTLADFKEQLGNDVQKVQVIFKALDTEKLQQLGTDLPLLKFGKTQLTKFLADLKTAQLLLKSKQIISIKNGENTKTIDDLIKEVTGALDKVNVAIKVADGTTEKQEKAFGLALSDIAKSLAYLKAQSKTIAYTFPLSDFDEKGVDNQLQKIEAKLEQLKVNPLLAGSDNLIEGQFDTQRLELEKQLAFFKDQLAYYKSFRVIVDPVNRAYTFIVDVSKKDAFGNYKNAIDLAQYQNSLDTLQSFIKTKQAPKFAGRLQPIKKQLESFITTAQATLKILQLEQDSAAA